MESLDDKICKVSIMIERMLRIDDSRIVKIMINIARRCKNAEEFDARLKNNGTEFPGDLVQSIFDLVRRNFPLKSEPSASSSSSLLSTQESAVPEITEQLNNSLGLARGTKGKVQSPRKVVEDEVKIKVIDQDPGFLLQGKGKISVDESEVKVLTKSGGLLNDKAMTQSSIFEIRNELRDQILPDSTVKRLGDVGFSEYDMPKWKKDTFAAIRSLEKISRDSINERRESLPIFRLKEEIIQALRENQVLVVVGEAGSGKTTQLTQYLAEQDYSSRGKIVCTQPYKEAAVTAAERVAEEIGCWVGEEVGYSILFEDCTGEDTIIEYMTDSELLREIARDQRLSKYSVIVIDEAQERTVCTDVLFGLMKILVQQRPDIRVVVASAWTLDTEKLSLFFRCSVVAIPRRQFPVDIVYENDEKWDFGFEILTKILKIHKTEPEGDIILFLPGQEEVDYTCQILSNQMMKFGEDVPKPVILPFYSALPSEIQSRICELATPGQRKVIVATDVAEALSTITGIHYIIDPGLVRQYVYNPKLALDSLVVTPTSQESAKQRARLAGLKGCGKCYRLYTRMEFKNEMIPKTVPEIHRRNLGDIALRMKAMKIKNLLSFEFWDRPSLQALKSALKQLYCLGALDGMGRVTKLGKNMAEFPLDPSLSKMLLASVKLGCSDEMLTIIAMVQSGRIFYKLSKDKVISVSKHRAFFHPEGDHLTLLVVYEAWKAHDYSALWCLENYVLSESMKRAHDFRKNLSSIMNKLKLDIVSSGNNSTKIRKAITSGLFFHAARKDSKGNYRTLVDDQPVFIYNKSVLSQKQPNWVVYNHLVMDMKECMHIITVIDPEWLVKVAPRFFKVEDPMRESKRKREESTEPLDEERNEPRSRHGADEMLDITV